MKKLLFLDVDGVLNDLEVLSTKDELGIHHLENLKSIVKSSGCEIILSSSWRVFEEWKTTLKIAFKQYDIPVWIDQTPQIRSEDFSIVPRKNEIIQWLKENINCSASVVVLDDESDADISGHGLQYIKDIFIHTCMNKGLTSEKAQKAIDFFKIV